MPSHLLFFDLELPYKPKKTAASHLIKARLKAVKLTQSEWKLHEDLNENNRDVIAAY